MELNIYILLCRSLERLYNCRIVNSFFLLIFLDLIYQHNVLLPESPFAAIRVSIPTLNVLIIAIPSFDSYKIFFCDNFPTLGQRLRSQLRPLINNLKLNKVLPESQNHQAAHIRTPLSYQPPKSHHFNSSKEKTITRKLRTPIFRHYYCQICGSTSSYWTLHPPFYPSIINPISTCKSQAQINQAQTTATIKYTKISAIFRLYYKRITVTNYTCSTTINTARID